MKKATPVVLIVVVAPLLVLAGCGAFFGMVALSSSHKDATSPALSNRAGDWKTDPNLFPSRKMTVGDFMSHLYVGESMSDLTMNYGLPDDIATTNGRIMSYRCLDGRVQITATPDHRIVSFIPF